MFLKSSFVLGVRQYLLRSLFVMGTCLALSFLIRLVFDVDMYSELLLVGAISIAVSSSKKKYVPKKQ